jgi:hypothetical protein
VVDSVAAIVRRVAYLILVSGNYDNWKGLRGAPQCLFKSEHAFGQTKKLINKGCARAHPSKEDRYTTFVQAGGYIFPAVVDSVAAIVRRVAYLILVSGNYDNWKGLRGAPQCLFKSEHAFDQTKKLINKGCARAHPSKEDRYTTFVQAGGYIFPAVVDSVAAIVRRVAYLLLVNDSRSARRLSEL